MIGDCVEIALPPKTQNTLASTDLNHFFYLYELVGYYRNIEIFK